MQNNINFLTDLKAGAFEGNFFLEWIDKDTFNYIPDENNKFRFIRPSGEIIIPDKMITTGGSTPRIVQIFDHFSPWEYGPAYMIHDWEFTAHELKITDKSFEDVNLTLAEALYTLMTKGFRGKVLELKMSVVRAIYLAVMSPAGRKIWDGEK
jgi:hypothetical protein